MKEELLKIAQESLSDDEVAEIVKDKFKNAIGAAIEKAFRWGDVEKAIEQKVKQVMIPYIEGYDFSEYLPKLDSVLTEIVNSDTCIGNKKILENFKDLMTEPEYKQINLTDLFELWIKRCEKDIDTDGLEVVFDDGPSYECVECGMRFEEQYNPSWSSLRMAMIVFENEHDESLNIEIPVSRWEWNSEKKEPWKISLSKEVQLSSLRYLNDFQVLLLRFDRAHTEIIIDKKYCDGEIRPEEEPEASFS